MAYITQQQKTAIGAELKKVVPKGWKYTLAIRDHSTIVFNLASAPVDILAALQKNSEHVRDYAQVNHYHIDSVLKGSDELIAVFSKIRDTLKGPDFFDNSDAQRDHFDVAHYININVGRFDRPFKYLPEAQ